MTLPQLKSIHSTPKRNAIIAAPIVLALMAPLCVGANHAQAKNLKKPSKVSKPKASVVKYCSFKVTWKAAKRTEGYQVKTLKNQ